MAHPGEGRASDPSDLPRVSYPASYSGAPSLSAHCLSAHWRPAADVYRNQQGWVVKLELAGIRSEDIEVAVEGRRLSIGGTRRDRPLDEAHRAYSMEIAYNRFLRAIDFPHSLDGVRVSTEYRDGMLLIYLTNEANP